MRLGILWILVGVTLDLVGAASWGGRELSRSPANQFPPLLHPDSRDPCRIGERELIAAETAGAKWSQNGARNIIMRTDNKNGIIWVATAQSQAPAADRLLRELNLFAPNHQVDIIPVYVRGEPNHVADGPTHRSDRGVDSWGTQAGMARVDSVDLLWSNMALSYNAAPSAPTIPGKFSMLAAILRFHQKYPAYRISEWRPVNFAISWAVGNLGVPCFFEQISEWGAYDLLVRKTQKYISFIGERGISLLVWSCESWGEISDFHRAISRRIPRYAAMVEPMGLRGNAESWIRTSSASIDSVLTGDPLAPQWAVYFPGGIASAHFDLIPPIAEIRTLNQSYRLAEAVCAEDPNGGIQTNIIHGAAGKTTAISTDEGDFYSRRSHIPYIDSLSRDGERISWQLRTSADLQPTADSNWPL